ncbi:hypothetical protein [Raoultella ornithinolytica]|uniref:hypothetical protein n=1 Tax=Raoultella ornithinolytica TaxID=54291 RepID=UPI000B4D2855|nr:hypothetical protein [Raoultella ornithinolytica]OWP44715.1 hypothetical protein CEG93_02175 [Raoultella ornithinolytica]
MNIETVNELIASLESADELSIKERKYLELAKAYVDREAESAALALTFEKCREISNCPAGVDLQDHLRQLAAESVAMKSFGDTLFDMYKGLEISGGGIHDEQSVVCQQAALDAAMSAFEEIEPPATDRIVAAQRSAFVDEAVAKITESGALTFGDCLVALCQLREVTK